MTAEPLLTVAGTPSTLKVMVVPGVEHAACELSMSTKYCEPLNTPLPTDVSHRVLPEYAVTTLPEWTLPPVMLPNIRAAGGRFVWPKTPDVPAPVSATVTAVPANTSV